MASKPPPNSDSTGRVLWIIFCCLMAAGWFFFTWFTVVIPLIMVPLSLLAIRLPVGKPRENGSRAAGDWGPSEPAPASRVPGWYSDPWGAGRHRYWNGTSWTRDVGQGANPPPHVGHDGPTHPAPPSSNPGWYKDPWGVGSRYWNGNIWTASTR